MTKKQILLETVEFYKNNPRSLKEDGSCAYKGPNEEKCAFSRVVEDKYLGKLVEGHSAYSIIVGHSDGILKKKYQGHVGDFWNSVQALHDGHGYWKGQEFTREGQEKLTSLIDLWESRNNPRDIVD